MHGCCSQITCPACCGSGGRMQTVRCCPLPMGSICCCLGCTRMQWVKCYRCYGRGVIPAPIPTWYPPVPHPHWPPVHCNTPFHQSGTLFRGDARADAAAARS